MFIKLSYLAFPTKSVLASQGLNSYKQFKTAVYLEVSQRQRQQNNDNDADQENFMNLLSRLRDGMTNKEQNILDWQFLFKKQVPNR